MSQPIGLWTALAWTALQAALFSSSPSRGLRLSQRRLLAELNAFDVVVSRYEPALHGGHRSR